MDHEVTFKSAWTDLKRWRVPLVVLALSALVISLVEYWFLSGAYTKNFPEWNKAYSPGVYYGAWKRVPPGTEAPWWGVLGPWAWWVGGTFALWVIVPMVAARVLGFRPLELGLRWGGLLRKAWIYGVFFLIVMVGVWWASTQEGFTRMYPMLKPWFCERWTWAVLLCFWALYGLQFFAVEFFFRGWMLFTLEKDFGLGAIAVMTVPYCMIHFHKPLPEALGAIVAGTVLGWMALKTRSIWGGELLHTAIALCMDIAALLQGDWGLPKEFGP